RGAAPPCDRVCQGEYMPRLPEPARARLPAGRSCARADARCPSGRNYQRWRTCKIRSAFRARRCAASIRGIPARRSPRRFQRKAHSAVPPDRAQPFVSSLLWMRWVTLTFRTNTLPKAKITALGCYAPPRVLTNHDLEKMVETSDQWIMDRTGIRERHIADPE